MDVSWRTSWKAPADRLVTAADAGSGVSDRACFECVEKSSKPKIVRYARVTAGFALLPVGVAMLVLPGPGIPVVVGSLMLLEDEFGWAGRARGKINTLAQTGKNWVTQQVASRQR